MDYSEFPKVTPAQTQLLGLGSREGLENYIKKYMNGRDVAENPKNLLVIDFFGLSEREVQQNFPEAFQYLISEVKFNREEVTKKSTSKDVLEYAKKWWLFGKPRENIRPALLGLNRYIVTPVTSKHRVFVFLDSEILADDALMIFPFQDSYELGILSSSTHVKWTSANASSLGMYIGNVRYIKSRCFDPFPFPDPDDTTRAEISALAEELDAHRKRAQAEHGVTLTQMYNVLEKLRAGEALDEKEQDIHDKALVTTLKYLHEQLDEAVARAYGWAADLSEQDILANLVALNKERAAEEQKGHVRWLRPDYQIPRFDSDEEKTQIEADLLGEDKSQQVAKTRKAAKPAFPRGEVEQTIAVTFTLASSDSGLSAAEIARRYKDPKRVEPKVAFTLRALARMGELRSDDGGNTFMLRQAA